MQALNTASDSQQSAVILSRYSYAYPESQRWALQDASLRMDAGQCHLLKGPTGSGKTTLLMAIRGLLPPGRQRGKIRVPGSPTGTNPSKSGLVLQNPKTQLLCQNLGADVAFGLENHCVAPSTMPGRVGQALKSVGLDQPLQASLDNLSMGQQYRACLAGIMVMDPLLVLMDEPMAQLDPRGCQNIISIIKRLKRSGRAILISEHRDDALTEVIDHVWHLNVDGQIVAPLSKKIDSRTSSGAHAPITATEIKNPSAAEHHRRPTDSNAKCVIEVKGLQFKNPHGVLDLSALSFRVSQGDRIVICGPNGSGKSTLIRCLAGLVHPDSGSATVLGAAPDLARVRDKITVLFQDPQKQIFETTVFDEVAFFARRSGMPAEHVKRQVNDILHRLELSHIAQASPHMLSYGQQRLVGLAVTLAGMSEILLLDDPFAGLDTGQARKMMQQVVKISAARGATVIWTTHDPNNILAHADRVIDLSQTQREYPPNGPMDTSQEEVQTLMHLPAHRKGLSTGVMLGLTLLLSMAAFAARSPAALAGLTGFNLIMIAIVCPRPANLLRKSARIFFWQAALIVLLYGVRFGVPDGLTSGLRVAWQLFLAFWPGMIFMASNSQPRIMRTLSRVLPQRTAFVTATCMRFLPMLLSEMQQIREAQILRGARILSRDLKTPCFWPDWLNCLLVPTLIKTLSLVSDIALAATARDFGLHSKRTTWPGE